MNPQSHRAARLERIKQRHLETHRPSKPRPLPPKRPYGKPVKTLANGKIIEFRYRQQNPKPQ